ncbi:glycerophosphodiester phosphodiesterase family protein [Rhodohalobacter sp.]|uniref:glycerophosphodiester phosphodiesterase family protein n=1 Tax=Rhodohalobacter sp. TaxID=1974210 RepID=UPI002ACE6A9E|nr:glycerophosphodiester phosphodiesterase family protein [Rhodohalobacter sp.]MDZ7755285.1 glycerophosphodiester phosphodiesterase family protein [Rhodohalobacter sp.]
MLSRAVEEYASKNDLPPPHYNIETKSNPEWYGEYVPGPEEFSKLLYEELSELGVLDRVIIQSFDPSTLIAFKQLDPDVKQAMLVINDVSPDIYISLLGYTPDIWSPDYKTLDTEAVSQLQSRGMKVIPWTVNTVDEMRELLRFGVDGFITDYPDSAAVLR